LHPGIWWGALMTILGGFYCFKFLPSKTQRSSQPKLNKDTAGAATTVR